MSDEATNQDWPDQVQEEALEPDLAIIDPHHHLWNFKAGQVNPRYFLDEMLKDINTGHNIVASFFRLTADYSADEKAKMYHNTAQRVYKL